MYQYNLIIYFLLILFISGCFVNEDIKTKEQFNTEAQSKEISIMTKDTAKYFLSYATLSDSIIKGTGTMEKNNILKDFNGEIKLSDIIYIQAKDFSFWGTVATVGVVGFLGFGTAAMLSDDKEGVKVKVLYPYGGGGGSCPMVYSKVKSNFKLEGEAIPLSLGKKLETETTNLISYIIPGEKEIEVRIANERPETHYINSVRLLKYNCETGYRALADECNIVWPVGHPEAPLYAEELNRHNVTSEIVKEDELYWKSDLSTANPSGSFSDAIIINFRKGKFQNSASLIVKAINTRLSDVIFRKAYDFLGDDILDFVYAVENDTEMISLLKGWFDEAALKAFLWNGSTWIYKGKIDAEATKQSFERLIRLDLKDIDTNPLKIKLEFMTDVWEIDAVSIDYSEVKPPKPVELPLISADVSNKDVRQKILKRDGDYQVLLPGDKIDLKFYDKSASQNSHYFVNLAGYLYEWYIKNEDSGPDFMAFVPGGTSRLELFKKILNNRNLLLSPVYLEWERARKNL